MQRQLITYGSRYAVRHPLRAVRMGLLASALLKSANAASAGRERVSGAADPLRRAAGDRRVRRESRRARAHAAAALRRTERIGVINALDDRRVARRVRRARRHGAKAVALSVRRPRRHRLRNVVVFGAGAGAVAAGVAVARRSGPDAEVPVDSAAGAGTGSIGDDLP